MLTPLQRMNAAAVVQLFDADGDEAFDWRDIARRIDAMAATLDVDQASPVYKQSVEAHRSWWERICQYGSIHVDDRLTMERFLAVAERGHLLEADHLRLADGISDAALEMAAPGGPGSLTERDIVRIYRGAGIDEATARAVFVQADVDRDGIIDRDEWRAVMRGVFTAATPEDAGAKALANTHETGTRL